MKNYTYLFLIAFSTVLFSCSSDSDDTTQPEGMPPTMMEENNNPTAVVLNLINQDCETSSIEWTTSVDPDTNDTVSYTIAINNTTVAENLSTTEFTFNNTDFTFPITITVVAQDNDGAMSEQSNELVLEEISDIITFTSETLKQVLLSHEVTIDENGDGEISICEAELFTGVLDIANQNISDISDIIHFSNALNLDARGNLISDVSILTDLNFELIALDFNNITNFNMGSNQNLERLFLSNNPLTTIDLTLYPNLTDISLLNNNGGNELSIVDVTNNPNLTDLIISGNQISVLDLSQNPNLVNLIVASNLLTILDISNNPLLTRVAAGANPLTSLFTGNNPALEQFTINDTFIEFLDLSNNGNLTMVWAQDNPSLIGINLANGNNSSLNNFVGIRSPLLSCIQVDDVSNVPMNWMTDEEVTSFSEDCQF